MGYVRATRFHRVVTCTTVHTVPRYRDLPVIALIGVVLQCFTRLLMLVRHNLGAQCRGFLFEIGHTGHTYLPFLAVQLSFHLDL